MNDEFHGRRNVSMVSIRRLTVDDLFLFESELLDLLVDTIANSYPFLPKKCKRIGQDKWMELVAHVKNDTAKVFGAFCGVALVGYVWVHCYDFLGERRLHVSQIAVLPQHQRMQIGSKMLVAMEQYAASIGIGVMELAVTKRNQRAMAVYQSQNFEVERYFMKKYIEVAHD